MSELSSYGKVYGVGHKDLSGPKSSWEVRFTTAKGRTDKILVDWDWDFGAIHVETQQAAAKLLEADLTDEWVIVEIGEGDAVTRSKVFRSWFIAYGLLDK